MEKTIRGDSGIDSFKVNSLIFKELVKRGYSVEGKNKVYNIADSKLWYITPEQSQAFLDAEKKDAKQRMFLKKEAELLAKSFKQVAGAIGETPLNIVDIGSRDGEKAFAFIKNFKDKSKLRYCPLDINNFMMEKAIKTLSRAGKLDIVRPKIAMTDFVNLDDVTLPLKKGKFKTNFLLLLGGNLENSDVHELLHDVRSAMKDGDYLLIGNKLAHKSPKKMVKYYNTSEYIENLLSKTAEQLGMSGKEVEYSARFRGSRVELLYTLKNDKTIESGGKKIDFRAGDKIILIISYKYTKDSLMETLNLYFDDVALFPSSDGIYALALCKK